MAKASWLQPFVSKTVRAWPQRPKANPPTLAEKLAALTRQQIGDFGELDVEQRLAHHRYSTARSPGSRSPSDVWGLRVHPRFVHLPLKQVKATMGTAAATLDDDARSEFAEFAEFVWEAFKASDIVPDELRSKPLVVSTGYAGVHVVNRTVSGESRTVTKLRAAFPLYPFSVSVELRADVVRPVVDMLHAFEEHQDDIHWTSIRSTTARR